MEMKNENESVSENENESHDKSVQQIQHPFHKEHPLVLVAEQRNEGFKAYCDGCGELLLAPCFTCFHCNYHLHKQCAEAPLEIPNHRLHPKHSYAGFFLQQKPCLYDDLVYGCALCKEKRNMFFYACNDCFFFIDIKCAQLSSSFKFSQLSEHDIHQHPLTFIESPMAIDVLKRLNCCWCHEPLTDDIYLCPDCTFIIHKRCLDKLPTEIDLLTHRLHHLILNRSDSDYLCNLCQKQHSGPFYGCSLCHFNINVECAWPRSTVEDKSRHQHPFTILMRQDSFICDACGTERNCISYICSTCSLMVHKDCTSLPRIIKFSRHDHWKSIWSARGILEKGLCWRVGKGDRIDVWEDLFNAEVVKKILQIPLATTATEDFQVWRGELSGIFSVRSAYKLLQEDTQIPINLQAETKAFYIKTLESTNSFKNQSFNMGLLLELLFYFC